MKSKMYFQHIRWKGFELEKKVRTETQDRAEILSSQNQSRIKKTTCSTTLDRGLFLTPDANNQELPV
jgi:hypothetical protein